MTMIITDLIFISTDGPDPKPAVPSLPHPSNSQAYSSPHLSAADKLYSPDTLVPASGAADSSTVQYFLHLLQHYPSQIRHIHSLLSVDFSDFCHSAHNSSAVAAAKAY